jgi:hypothetical protein
MKIQEDEATEFSRTKDKKLTDEEIELYCQSVEELLANIHDRCGPVE